MSESLEEKQQYLRNEILDQGYNAEDFSNYMSSIRGENALDLELWTLSDLQTVVNQYRTLIAQKVQEQSVEQNNEEKNNFQNQEQEQKNETENNNSPQEGNEDIESDAKNNSVPEVHEQKNANSEKNFPKEVFEEYEQIIKTEKLEINDITEQNDLYVTITNPTKKGKGIFSSSYYVYTVQTHPVGYNVLRKVSDFTFLYETLPFFNSGVFNPVLPHFEFKLKDDSPKKILYLKNYINSVIENRYFRALPIIFEFLSLPQEEWDKKKEKYIKLKPYPMYKIPTFEGEFHIKINKFDDNRGFKIKDEINKREEAYDEFNTAMDELLATIDKLSQCYKSVAKSLYDLTKTHQDNNKDLTALFNRLLSLTKIWANNYIKQRDFLRDEIKYYFKYMNKENASFLKKYDEFKTARDDYKSKYEKVKKQPIKTLKDLEVVEKMRKDYGFQLIMINSEYQKLFERQAYRSKVQFMKYNENKNIILQNFNNCIKLFNINEEQNNKIDEEAQNQDQDWVEVENQNISQENNKE